MIGVSSVTSRKKKNNKKSNNGKHSKISDPISRDNITKRKNKMKPKIDDVKNIKKRMQISNNLLDDNDDDNDNDDIDLSSSTEDENEVNQQQNNRKNGQQKSRQNTVQDKAQRVTSVATCLGPSVLGTVIFPTAEVGYVIYLF